MEGEKRTHSMEHHPMTDDAIRTIDNTLVALAFDLQTAYQAYFFYGKPVEDTIFSLRKMCAYCTSIKAGDGKHDDASCTDRAIAWTVANDNALGVFRYTREN